MPAAIEHTVEIHGIQLPARGDGRNVFVEPRDERYVAGAGFSGHACVRDAEGAVFEDAGAQEGREGAGNEVCVVLGVGLGEGVEGFVCAETIAYANISILPEKMG